MAIVRDAKYPDATNRRYQDSTAMDIIYRAMDKENVEYLPNGSRRLRIVLRSGNVGLPVGACGNGALAMELKILGDNIYQIKGRIGLKLFYVSSIYKKCLHGARGALALPLS